MRTRLLNAVPRKRTFICTNEAAVRVLGINDLIGMIEGDLPKSEADFVFLVGALLHTEMTDAIVSVSILLSRDIPAEMLRHAVLHEPLPGFLIGP